MTGRALYDTEIENPVDLPAVRRAAKVTVSVKIDQFESPL
jgi:hypothetical protein